MKKNVLIALLMCLMATSQLFAQTITTVAPASGIAGASIVISGTGFTGTMIVQFGGVNAASFTVNSPTQITAVLSANGNSGFTTVGSVTNTTPFTYTPTIANTLAEADVVINKVYNSTTAGGADDAVEILVAHDKSDLRSLYLKDFQANKNGGSIAYFFKEIPFWSQVRAGTLIVLRNKAGASADTDPSDFTLDINLLDLNYMIAGNGSSTVSFDIDQDNMVSLQKNISGTNFPISILGGGPQTGLSFGASIFYRLTDATIAGAGTFTYIVNANSVITDYRNPSTTASTYVADASRTRSNVTLNENATPAALVLGMPNNATNATYITGLRATVLPVNLISFTAKKGTNGIELNWATASEQNNNRFELQRSADGNSFVTIKTVTGANNANSRNNYSFLDKNPIAGVNYYKLVQIDNDGTVKELGVQAVSSDLKGLAFNVSSYGEVNQINYTVYATTSGKANVTVFDLSGKQVANIAIDLAAGNNNLKINSNNLKSGVYVAVLKAENNTLTSKFVK
jgi:hypothetical protein